MDGKSLNLAVEKINDLRNVMPEVFTEGKIDWEKLKATLGEDINFSNERYVLNWAGKSDAFKVLQMPTTKTLIPAKEESVNFDETENIFIEGENLEVLKVLQKSYFGKVKMIYIDPPYNTGNDSFIYPDKFSESKADYEKRVGDKDEEGYMTKDGMFKKNSKENGQYHSNWLNMMMPRLYLAKNLLRQDGVIFVSIDDNEVHNLRLLMNEIFGEENFVAELIWKCRAGGGADSKFFSSDHEYILCFSKNINDVARFYTDYTEEQLKKFNQIDEKGKYFIKTLEMPEALGDRPNLQYPIEAPDGSKIESKREGVNYTWVLSESEFLKYKNKGLIEFKKNNDKWMVYRKYHLDVSDGEVRKTKPRSILDKIALTSNGSKELKLIFDENERKIFDNPKPISLLSYLANIVSSQNDIILDFFAGSGSTAHAVMDLNKEDGGNRKYICVQLPELCDEKSEAYKAGYKTIAEISKERIRRAGKSLMETKVEVKKTKGKQTLGLDFGENSIGYAVVEKGEFKSVDYSENVKNLDVGFKVLKLADSNFKQWQQIEGKNATALAEQMKLFVDPVSEYATIENMVYELLLKSGKDLNSTIEKNDGYFLINGNEMALILEKVSQEIITEVMSQYPKKVIALDKLFKGNDQLKTNTVLQMRDAGVEFKTI